MINVVVLHLHPLAGLQSIPSGPEKKNGMLGLFSTEHDVPVDQIKRLAMSKSNLIVKCNNTS